MNAGEPFHHAGPATVGSVDEQLSPETLLEVVKVEAHHLAQAVKAAEAGGVPPALLLPALAGVLREAGMMPEGFDLGGVLGMLDR